MGTYKLEVTSNYEHQGVRTPTFRKGATAALVSVITFFYILIEARFWFWGYSSGRGTYVEPALLSSYQIFKLIIILLCFTLSILTRSWRLHKHLVPLYLLLFWVVLSTFWSYNFYVSLQQLFLLLGTISVCMLNFRNRAPKDILSTTAKALFFIAVSGLVAGAFFQNIGLMHGAHNGALRGFLFHKNHFGAACAFSTCLCLYFYLETKLIKWLLLSVLSTLAAILSSSASAVVMIVVLFTIILLQINAAKMHPLKRKRYLVNAILLLSILLVLTYTFWTHILSLLGRDPDMSSRIGIWQVVFDYLISNPFVFVFGSGPGGATGDQQLIYLMKNFSGYSGATTSHNSLLDITLNFGIIGIFLCFCIFTYYLTDSNLFFIASIYSFYFYLEV